MAAGVHLEISRIATENRKDLEKLRQGLDGIRCKRVV
jgi:hypothetical protein